MDSDRLERAVITIMNRFQLQGESARRFLSRVIADVVAEEWFAEVNHDCDHREFEPPEGGRTYLKIPFFAREADAHPLGRCIQPAAAEIGCSHHATARALTRFLEALADEVDSGRLVRIPGFGVFGPYAQEHRSTGNLVVYPRFIPARGFRLQVRERCPVSWARNHQLETYRRSHHPTSKPDKSGSRTHLAMEAIRTAVLAHERVLFGVTK